LVLLYCTPTNNVAQQLGYATGIDLLLNNPLSNATLSSDHVGTSSQAVVNLFWFTAGRPIGFGLTLLLALLVFSSGGSSVTASSRIAYALARDGVLPGSQYLLYVSPTTQAPVGTVLLVFITDTLLLLLPLGSTTAFTQMTAMSSIGYQLSCECRFLLVQCVFTSLVWQMPFRFCCV
jgi:amino acid transporter